MTILQTIELTQVNCGECGGTYAINSRYHQEKREQGGYWSCPYCRCAWGYSKSDSEVARLKRKLEYEEAARVRQQEYTESERRKRKETERRLNATKGVVTRIKNRIGKGICPCCNRHFSNLQQHMENQHPEFSDSND